MHGQPMRLPQAQKSVIRQLQGAWAITLHNAKSCDFALGKCPAVPSSVGRDFPAAYLTAAT